jgi:hypothetical protein
MDLVEDVYRCFGKEPYVVEEKFLRQKWDRGLPGIDPRKNTLAL